MQRAKLNNILIYLRKKILRAIHLLPLEVVTLLILTLLSVFCLIKFVNLTPSIDNNFFFSSDDPQFQSEHLINRLFIRKDSQLIITATGDIQNQDYQEKISQLSTLLLDLRGVANVNSLTHSGPKSLNKAFQSPLWKRLIISNDKKSTNLLVLLDEEKASVIIPKIETLMSTFEEQNFHLRIAGMPYVVELIKRYLLRDLKIFSLLAFIIFGLFIFHIFLSKSVFWGTMIACLNACIWTFMITNLIGIPMGLLTANLGTIVFIMTLSHIIFLSYNWRTLRKNSKSSNPVNDALKRTFTPSCWSMLTTFFGFLSLTTVSAKPLRDLGASGAVGSLIAIIAAYSVFPAFLRMAGLQDRKQGQIERFESKTYRFIDLEKQFIMLIIIVTCLLTLPGLAMLDTDPSLLSYFSKNSEIYKGFSYIDKNGGSSPLILVVRSKSLEKIHSAKSYDQLWKLQESLEQHRSVGSVISLPVLIAQARDTPLVGWFLPRETLISAMESPHNDAVAKSFITSDRKYGLFFLRMNESYRSISRIDIVNEIKMIIETEGFYPEIIGGIYNLQGHLAKLVASSLVWGLITLILLFTFIVWIISRSLQLTLAVGASIFIIPLTVLGCFGIYRIPLDIISSPASNIAIAMGIDSMIHMIQSYKRTKNWQKVRDELWQPILTSMIVVATGFAIFLFSSFPPTRRFGGAILLGTVLSALTALYIMPLLTQHIHIANFFPLKSKRKNHKQ